MADGPKILLAFLTLYVGQTAAILVHELGHVIAASICGWKPMVVKVGSGPPLKFQIGDWQFLWSAWPVSGRASAYPRNAGLFRLKWAVFAMGGPVATAGILWLLWQSLGRSELAPEWVWLGLNWLCFVQLVMLVGSLVPHWVKIDGTLVASDMLQVWQALRTKKEEARNRVLGMMISRAAVHLDRGEMERAREWVAEICGHLEPQAVCGARMSWIYVLVSRGQTEEVAREKSAMIENWQSLKASRAEVLDGLACLPIYYGWPEMLDEGLEYIERALREAPGLITLKGTKSSLLIEKGELDEGLRLLEEVAESTASENDRAIIGYYRALAYLKKGDRTNARHLLREAAEKYPRCIVKARIEGIFWNEPEGREGSSAESLGKLE